MMEDNLKELVKMQKKIYEIISRSEELQKVIELIERRRSCIICVRDCDISGVIDAKFEIGRCYDEDDVCSDIVEALKMTRDKYIKEFEDLDAETKEGEKWKIREKKSCRI